MHFLFAPCENYALLHAISNWTELSIPCGVISSTDVTIVTSSFQNYQNMLKIEFPTKPISRIYNFFNVYVYNFYNMHHYYKLQHHYKSVLKLQHSSHRF